jgi:predicted DNA-binding transcriptional regulator AlpA
MAKSRKGSKMRTTTQEAIRSILRADDTIGTDERAKLIAFIRNEIPPSQPQKQKDEERLIRRHEAAKRFSVSVRAIDRWAKTGILKKRVLPGRKRACGFLASEVQALIAGC